MGAGDVIKMLRVFPCCGLATHTHFRAATVLPPHWPIKAALPVSSTAILMRHSSLQWKEKGKNRRLKRKRKRGIYTEHWVANTCMPTAIEMPAPKW